MARRSIRNRRRKRIRRGVSRWFIAVGVLAFLVIASLSALAGVAYGVYQSYADELVPPDEALANLPPGGARILDRNGNLLYQYLNPEIGHRKPVPFEEISPFLIDATIAAEDASFYENPGVNYRGLVAAAIDNFNPFGKSPGFLQGRGGSSITQQLVKNVYFSPEERSKRTIDRKLKETVYAIELTRQNPGREGKDQILEWYLNLISYGSVYTGAEAAAQGYFGVSARDLTLGQAALLAGIPASPSKYDPINNSEAAKDRQVDVLTLMLKEEKITAVQFRDAKAATLEIIPQRFPVDAPHFVFNVVEPALAELGYDEEALLFDGLTVRTTVDLTWQMRAEAILNEHISANEDRTDGHNGAFVAIDPNTAEILVYVGSRDFFDEEIKGQNDNADGLNSPGSAFKPFVYLTAFMKLGWGPGTVLLDTEYTYADPNGRSFRPCNPGGCNAFDGAVTVRYALGNSLNVPAVKTMLYAGVQSVVTQALDMGITSFEGRAFGPALTTGGGDVKLVDMTYSYTAFPNLGVLRGLEPAGIRPLDPVTILRVDDHEDNILYPLVGGEPVEKLALKETRVAPAAEIFLINDILLDGSAECRTFGCGRLSISRHPLAVKTGTSSPFERNVCRGCTGDTWTFAYTPHLVAGTWYGNADNSPMRNVSSTTVSWPIMRDFMAAYHADLEVRQFSQVSGLTRASVCIVSGLLPTSDVAPNCPPTPLDLFVAASLPEQTDFWWTRAIVDSSSCRVECKLAGEDTPSFFIQERYFLNPPEGLSEFELQQAEEWVDLLANLPGAYMTFGPAPTEVAETGELPILISAPQPGAHIPEGVILAIIGTANSEQYQSHALAYRPASSPQQWAPIPSVSGSIENGLLGTWNTSGLTPGSYILQLGLIDSELGAISIEIQIEIGEPGNDEQESSRQPGRGRGPPDND